LDAEGVVVVWWAILTLLFKSVMFRATARVEGTLVLEVWEIVSHGKATPGSQIYLPLNGSLRLTEPIAPSRSVFWMANAEITEKVKRRTARAEDEGVSFILVGDRFDLWLRLWWLGTENVFGFDFEFGLARCWFSESRSKWGSVQCGESVLNVGGKQMWYVLGLTWSWVCVQMLLVVGEDVLGWENGLLLCPFKAVPPNDS
jgi:hypothetical protein